VDSGRHAAAGNRQKLPGNPHTRGIIFIAAKGEADRDCHWIICFQAVHERAANGLFTAECCSAARVEYGPRLAIPRF
jgi:hypothetical protein